MELQQRDFPLEGTADGEKQTVPIPEPLHLRDARENVLTKCLAEKSRLLHQIYVGALKVLRQFDNPDRLSLAANGFRELMGRVSPRIS